MPGGEKMVAFTRILHRSLDDEIMDEVILNIAALSGSECGVFLESMQS